MKNKAPGKIYLNIPFQYTNDDDAFEVATWDEKTWKDCVNVAYVHRDGLIDLLNDRIKARERILEFDDPEDRYAIETYKEIIDLIKSL